MDLEHVNPLQQAVIERARAAGSRDKWLPEISIPQWILSVLVALLIVYGIFKVVDGGLTAFQKFAEVALRPSPAETPPAPEIDLTQPVPIILVPEGASAPPPPAPSNSP